MSVSSRCPSSAELVGLLDGNGSDPSLVSHLDGCTGCQNSLEALANGDSSISATLLEQAALMAPASDSAYWPALKDAENALTLETPTLIRPRAEISLSFLDPPADGSHLGSLNNFEIVRVIGRGGMGIVLHAIDTCLQRDVAIKVLDPELSKDELAGQRFCREARAAASVSHENVVAVHQVERDDVKNLPFLVMELITGISLEKRLEKEGRLSLREIVSIGMQTAAGLAAAHDKGLIHRDIKPGNILLEMSGQRVKLTDFGLARAAEDVRLTRSGMVAGTPLYMSPEQAIGEELDARSDLFSLGVVLYELAAGEPPFMGKTPLAVLKRVTDEQPIPLGEKNPDLPEWFVHIVDKLLAKKPEDRYQSAREVANTLEQFWVLLKSSDTIKCPKKKAADLRRSIVVGTLAGLATLLVGGLAAFFLLPHRDRPEDRIPMPLHVFKGGTSGALWSLDVSKDGTHIATGTDDGTVKLWDIAGEKVAWTLPAAHKAPVWALALSPSGDLLATGGDDGRTVLWDVKTQKGRELTEAGGARAVAFDADGRRLVTGGRNGTVKVWDVATGAKLAEAAGHSGIVGAVAFSPDGKTLASAGSDKTIKIWDAATGSLTLTLSGHENGVYGIAFAPGGRRLVSGSWDRTLRVWDLDSGNTLAKLEGPTQDVWSVAFHPAGKLFASAGEDQMVRVWSVETNKEVTAFRGSTGAILNVRFTPDGAALIAGGKDSIARMWLLSSLNITP